MATYGGDEVSALVLDVGSCLTKCGYAGEDTPRAVFPTIVGVSSDGNSEPSNSNRKYYVGDNEIIVPRPNVEMKNPLNHGLIKDWDAMEKVWEHAFLTKLRINMTEHPILVSEPSFNTRESREKLTQIFFEKYQTPGLFLCKDAVLSCFGSGRSTGIVLDSGGDVTRVTPVYDGYVLKKNIVKQNFAGNDITQEILSYLEDKYPTSLIPQYQIQSKQNVEPNQPAQVVLKEFNGISQSFHNQMKLRIAVDFKETLCQVAEVKFNESNLSRLPMKQYEFPSGYNSSFGIDRYRIAEHLFNPSLSTKTNEMEVDGNSKSTKQGVHKMLFDSISKCDPDARPTMFGGIIVTGGNTLYPGFVERLQNELTQLAPSYKQKLIAPTNTVERKFSVWIGGSILASLGAFHQMWMSKAEYDEHGSVIVDRKCP